MTKREALKIMGLSGECSAKDLKKKYHELMTMTHPDVAKKQEYPYDAKEINLAYEYLKSHAGSKNYRNYEKQGRSGGYEQSDNSAASGSKRNRRDGSIKWDAPVNNNAYSSRDILHNVEDLDGNVIGTTVIATGKYMWTVDEEFGLFLRSIYLCSKEIISADDETCGKSRVNNIKLQADITYLLAQQFVDSETALSIMTKKGSDDVPIYELDAMLETDLRQVTLKAGDYIYPVGFSEHKLYVTNEKGTKLGYISFKDDRLYYGIIPLLERRAAQVKMQVESAEVKKFMGRKYLDVKMQIKLLNEDKKHMIDSINLKIDKLLERA